MADYIPLAVVMAPTLIFTGMSDKSLKFVLFDRFVFLVALFLFLLIIYTRFKWLLQQVYPLDFDGFYYLLEFRSRIEEGHSYFGTANPYFFITTGIGRLIGAAPMQIYNSSVIGSYLLFLLALGLCSFNREICSPAAVLVSAAARSDAIFYLFYGYPKQGFALAMFTLGLALFKLAGTRSTTRAVAGAALLLAAVVHLFAAATLAAAGSAALSLRMRRFPFVLLCSFAVILGLTAAATFAGKSFIGELTWTGGFPWQEAAKRNWISQYEQFEYPVYFTTALLISAAAISYPLRLPLVMFLLVLLLSAPIWREGGTAWYRFLVSSPAIWFIGISALILQPVPLRAVKSWAISGAILLLYAAALINCGPMPVEGRRIGPAMKPELLSKSAGLFRQWLPEKAFIKAPHGIQYRVAYFLERRSAREFPKDQSEVELFELSTSPPRMADCVFLEERSNESTANCAALIAPGFQPWFIYRTDLRGIKTGQPDS